MISGCLQDFSGCSDGSCRPGGIWWSFQMKVWTLKIQRNLMIPNYSMIPAAAIRWSPGIWWSPAIRWSIRSMDFHNRKVYGDHTSITDGLVSTLADHFEIWRYLRLKCKVDLALRLGTTNTSVLGSWSVSVGLPCLKLLSLGSTEKEVWVIRGIFEIS